MLGTGESTEVAGNAQGLVGVGIDVQAGSAAVSFGHLRPLERVLLGIDFLRILVLEGDTQTLDQVDHQHFAQQARDPHAVRIPLRPKHRKELRLYCSPTIMADELWMEEALRAAQRALAIGEVPVGAVVVRNGNIVGRGWNRNLADHDPTAHAEVIALREAGATIGNHRLGDCELFVTIEPCAMCAGALVHARIKRLVYGAHDPKAGAVHSVMQVVNHPQLNHQTEVRGGVLAGRSAELLQEFFRNRR